MHGSEQSRPLTESVLRLLTELDPYGLTPGEADGSPADEYILEAKPMADLLSEEGVIRVVQVDSIWREWFGETLSSIVSDQGVADLVVKLNQLAIQSP